MKKIEKDKHAEAIDFLMLCSSKVDRKLTEHFSHRENFHGLLDAIRYSSIGGGKKIRPGLVYAVARVIGLDGEAADDIACSIEMMHVYSLIHDDLPMMDNDSERRGKPALHKAFSEALAILAGDAMQSIAYEMLADSTALGDSCKISSISILARASGTGGMAGGQAMDVLFSEEQVDVHTVEKIHRLKTGSLISACIHMPLACRTATPETTRRAFIRYAEHIGLCFQIRDDILDMEADGFCESKPTYPAAIGLEKARTEMNRLGSICMESLQPLDESAQLLRRLTCYITGHDA